jgi:hypothetical protein
MAGKKVIEESKVTITTTIPPIPMEYNMFMGKNIREAILIKKIKPLKITDLPAVPSVRKIVF